AKQGQLEHSTDRTCSQYVHSSWISVSATVTSPLPLTQADHHHSGRHAPADVPNTTSCSTAWRGYARETRRVVQSTLQDTASVTILAQVKPLAGIFRSCPYRHALMRSGLCLR